MVNVIEPKVLKGFRDFLPPAEIARRSLIEKIEASFRLYGFVPIDTPALEYAGILLGKGGGETEKQVYRFTDQGGRDVALRFDLTVPFARFVAQYREDLTFPFKRYHIAKVWRGENTQRGRYREFTQCDFDIVGSDNPAADFEILLMMRNTLRALGAEVMIHINHRGIFNRFLKNRGLAERSVEILRIVDKLAKIGRDETGKLLEEIAGKENAVEILRFISPAGSYEETLRSVTELAGGEAEDTERLKLLRRYMIDTGIGDSFKFDPSITRGLDYYTGIVYETFLVEDPSIGSICSGGRYDNLAGLYSKEQISGVGSSIGLDRLTAALEDLEKLPPRLSYANVFIACIREEDSGAYQSLAEQLRAEGIPCEVLLEAAGEGKPLGRQFSLAEKKGGRWVVIPGEKNPGENLSLRDLGSRKNREALRIREIIDLINGNL